jgi:hypothetical protein
MSSQFSSFRAVRSFTLCFRWKFRFQTYVAALVDAFIVEWMQGRWFRFDQSFVLSQLAVATALALFSPFFPGGVTTLFCL